MKNIVFFIHTILTLRNKGLDTQNIKTIIIKTLF